MLTRRRLLATLAGAALAGLATVGGALGLSRRHRATPERLTLPVPKADGATFHGEVILVREGAALHAFSSRCAHLGCRIARASGGELVCPCHGSRFDLGGRRLAGPASIGLHPLAFVRAGDVLTVELAL